MAFSHDAFITTQNYLDLDSLLQWYIDTVGPKVADLNALAIRDPAKLRLLYNRDPILQKLVKINRTLNKILLEAKGDD